jgi:anti-sigma factor (TIGR02949 family)
LDSLTCAEVFRRLDSFVDRELSPEELERVREHLEWCVQCAAEVRFETSFVREARTRLRHLAVPPDLAQRILSKLEGTDPPPPR